MVAPVGLPRGKVARTAALVVLPAGQVARRSRVGLAREDRTVHSRRAATRLPVAIGR